MKPELEQRNLTSPATLTGTQRLWTDWRSLGICARQKMERSLVYTALALGSLVTLFPLLWLVRSSLMTLQQIFIFPPEWIPNPWRWSNYPEALTTVPFFQYFLNTMKILVPVVIGTVTTSSLAAYSFARVRWPGRDLTFSILYTTLLLPYVVTLIPTFLVWAKLGQVNTFTPLIVPAWLGGGIFNIFLLRQFFRTIPRDLDDAAKIDGANHFQILWYVILPLSRPALITVAIFSFLFVWNDFLGPLIYLNSDDKYTLAIGLADFVGLYTAQWHLLMAAATVMLVPVVILFLIGQRYFIEGVTLTGLKG